MSWVRLTAGQTACTTVPGSPDAAPRSCARTCQAVPPPHVVPCRVAWSLLMDESKFVDWQKVKVQENPDEVGTDAALAGEGGGAGGGLRGS